MDDAKSRSILTLSDQEAKDFFLKTESYNNFDLPSYFVFDDLLKKTDDILNGKQLSDFQSEKKPRDLEKVNYTLFHNKDGKYAWRQIQLIHPAIYVDFVNIITQNWDKIKNRFREFGENPNIQCMSIPVESSSEEKDKAEQISHWWQMVEQKSIELALDYQYIFHTDISDCYGSIYTHSIPWALHTKECAKNNKNNMDLVGNVIDKLIQDMNFGQTNGIPQGSVLMDFVAEMVLGYADLELSKKINDEKNKDYFIIRYRDDYRIFVNNPLEGEKVLEMLTKVMIGLGMKVNSSKTVSSHDIIRSSIKEDKLDWLEKRNTNQGLQKHLLIVHGHSKKHSNSGSLLTALEDFYKCLSKEIELKESVMPMISIVVDIALDSPRTYPIVSAILSNLIAHLGSDEEKKEICKKIVAKIQQKPNTGYMQIWLQRFSMFFAEEIELGFTEPLTKLRNNSSVQLWNNEWISNEELKSLLDNPAVIFDEDKAKSLGPVIDIDEIRLFMERYYTA